MIEAHSAECGGQLTGSPCICGVGFDHECPTCKEPHERGPRGRSSIHAANAAIDHLIAQLDERARDPLALAKVQNKCGDHECEEYRELAAIAVLRGIPTSHKANAELVNDSEAAWADAAGTEHVARLKAEADLAVVTKVVEAAQVFRGLQSDETRRALWRAVDEYDISLLPQETHNDDRAATTGGSFAARLDVLEGSRETISLDALAAAELRIHNLEDSLDGVVAAMRDIKRLIEADPRTVFHDWLDRARAALARVDGEAIPSTPSTSSPRTAKQTQNS